MNNVKTEFAKTWIENELLPSLSNFCIKSPLNIDIKYIKDMNKIILSYNDKTIDVNIDITKDKKDIIRDIRFELEKDYPIIFERVTKSPSAEEVEDLMKNGMSLSDALDCINYEFIPRYKVIRKHDKFNELDIVDLKSNCIYKCKCKIPLFRMMTLIERKDELVIDNLNILYQMNVKGD